MKADAPEENAHAGEGQTNLVHKGTELAIAIRNI
jgi:hypothetical protein